MKRPLWYLYLIQLLFIAPSVAYWLEKRNWSLTGLTPINLFPLLGLIAFTLMWGHLMVAAYKKLHPDMFDYNSYYRKTGNIVLALIILHPMLLIIGKGSKFLNYAGDNGRIFIAFGSLALTFFLIYEVVDRLRERPFLKNNWQYVVAMNRIGFVLVFAHGLQIGQHLQSGWLRSLWVFYGVSVAVYFLWAYKIEIKRDSIKVD